MFVDGKSILRIGHLRITLGNSSVEFNRNFFLIIWLTYPKQGLILKCIYNRFSPSLLMLYFSLTGVSSCELGSEMVWNSSTLITFTFKMYGFVSIWLVDGIGLHPNFPLALVRAHLLTKLTKLKLSYSLNLSLFFVVSEPSSFHFPHTILIWFF